MYNTPAIRNGGFGALQVEAVTNRPLSIARRHYAASQLRMREIEPDELDSSEWVRFLVMEDRERERWMHQFLRRRSSSDGSTSSREDRETQSAKAEEARLEAEESRRNQAAEEGSSSLSGQTPAVSLWVRQFDGMSLSEQTPNAVRPLHRRLVADADVDAPPAYNTVARARTPPPAYEPRN